MPRTKAPPAASANGDAAPPIPVEAPKKDDAKEDAGIAIKAARILVLKTRVIGNTPLICNAFPDKVKQQMREKRRSKAGTESAESHPIRDFDREFRDSLYPLPDGSGYGFPAIAFKLAMIDACRLVNGLTMVMAKTIIFVESDAVSKGANVVRIIGKPTKREDIVRLDNQSRPPDLRYRGQFHPWSAWLRIRFHGNLLSREAVMNLLNLAGNFIGVGENRPSSIKKSGDHGTFHVATEDEQ